MKFIGLKKVNEGHFITRYDLTYETEEGNEKIYEMISRRKDLKDIEDLKGQGPDAVVIIATDESGEKILVNREYRMAVGDFVYNFPAGLIDPGETPEIAAARELKEETGLELYQIDDVLGLSYSAVGFSNEMNLTIVGRAKGSFDKSTSDVEEIEARWYTKEEMKKLLSEARFAARTQAYCYNWCRN